MPFISSK